MLYYTILYGAAGQVLAPVAIFDAPRAAALDGEPQLYIYIYIYIYIYVCMYVGNVYEYMYVGNVYEYIVQ